MAKYHCMPNTLKRSLYLVIMISGACQLYQLFYKLVLGGSFLALSMTATRPGLGLGAITTSCQSKGPQTGL